MGSTPVTKPAGTQGAGDEFDFEVDMWDDAAFADGPTSTSTNPINPTINPSQPPAKPPAPSLDQDEDQDMWDLVDELQTRAGPSSEGAGKPPAPMDDDDWDSMYA